MAVPPTTAIGKRSVLGHPTHVIQVHAIELHRSGRTLQQKRLRYRIPNAAATSQIQHIRIRIPIREVLSQTFIKWKYCLQGLICYTARCNPSTLENPHHVPTFHLTSYDYPIDQTALAPHRSKFVEKVGKKGRFAVCS